MLQQTQDSMAKLTVAHPPIDGDKRHQANVDYPFMDYDDLSDEEMEPKYSLWIV